MPELILLPRVAPPDRLRVWIGAFGAHPGNLTWRLNGADSPAEQVRPLAPAHPHGATSFTGVYELADVLAERRANSVEVKASGGGRAALDIKPLPEHLPTEDWLRVLLLSCYHQAEDRGGKLGRAVRRIAASQRPDLTILMGDQVYLDLPTLCNFPNDEAKLSRRFERDYRKNWTADISLRHILSLAPTASVPDDHEYWNNYPHPATVIQNSWSEGGRVNWSRAANHLYDSYQVASPLERGDAIEINVPPMSLLLLDHRSHRKEDRSSALTPRALEQVDAWVDRLLAERWYGAVVTGQSMLDEPVGRVKGAIVDRNLANYADYERLVKSLVRAADAGRPILLVAGDVHWSRCTTIRESARRRFLEVICSPASLVTAIGTDQIRTIGSGIRGIFTGRRPRWPRHASPGKPPPFFAKSVFGGAAARRLMVDEPLHHAMGDQFAILHLRRRAGSVEAKVVYHEAHPSPVPPIELDLGLLRDRA